MKARNWELEEANEQLRSLVEELRVQQEELEVQQEELEVQATELAERASEIAALLKKERADSEALRLSEGRFKVIFEQVFAGVAELGAGGHIIRANATLSELLGYTGEELAGRRFYGLTHPEEVGEELKLFSRTADRLVDRYTMEKRLVRKDGWFLWVDSSLAAMRGASPLDDRFVLLIQDISKRKEAEEERERLLQSEQEARGQAERAVKARDEFLSLAAHELKTPVTSLRGFSQMLLRKHGRSESLDPDQVIHAIFHLDQQSRRLAALIDRLLDISRLETGKLSIAPQETDLTSVIENALASVRGVYPSRAFLFQGSQATHGLLDPLRTEQVMVNLLDNAAKFSPGEAPVEVELALAGQNEVEISVRDYGKGMAREDMERIFERFYQADAEGHLGGMGLGLYVSRQIVQMQGGIITCQAPEDGGSRFVVRLPLRGMNGRAGETG